MRQITRNTLLILAVALPTLSSCAQMAVGYTGTTTIRVPVGQSCYLNYSDYVASRLPLLPQGVTGRITQGNMRIILTAAENATIGIKRIAPAYYVEVVTPVSGGPIQTDESPCEHLDQPI